MADRLVCIGDSIVEGEGDEQRLGGWVGRLAVELSTAFQVFNLGIDGDTIRDIRYRFGEVLVRKPDYIILGCGTNDVKFYGNNLAHYTNKEFAISSYASHESWEMVLDQALVSAKKGILIVGMHPRLEEHNMSERAVENSEVNALNAFIEKLCNDKNIPFLSFSDFPADGYIDGSHLSGKGYADYADRIHTKIKSLGWV